MKILILSSNIPYPAKNGGSIATLGLASGLERTGNKITMLCLNTSRHYIPEEKLPERLISKIQIISVYHNTEFRFFSALRNLLFSNEPYNGRRFFSQTFESRLIQLLSSEKFDIIQLEGPYMGYYIPAIRKYCNSRIALRAHNVEHEIWSRRSINDTHPVRSIYLNILSRRIKIFETNILHSIDLLIPISIRDQKILLELNPAVRSMVIPAGLDIENYPEIKDPEYPSLFFIGSLDWMPNQEGLIWFIENVWPEVRKSSNIRFHIAGRGSPAWLTSKIESVNIEFHGEIENAYDFMNQYAIMISPVLSGSGIRVKILEAMMMGKAVISTTIGAEGISYRHGDHIIIADDPSAFADYIREYSSDRSLYDKIATRGRDFVLERFNNLAFCKTLGEFYSNNLK